MFCNHITHALVLFTFVGKLTEKEKQTDNVIRLSQGLVFHFRVRQPVTCKSFIDCFASAKGGTLIRITWVKKHGQYGKDKHKKYVLTTWRSW